MYVSHLKGYKFERKKTRQVHYQMLSTNLSHPSIDMPHPVAFIFAHGPFLPSLRRTKCRFICGMFWIGY